MNKNEKFAGNLCWKVYFLMNPEIEVEQKENFGIKSGKSPPQEPIKEMKPFIEDLCEI